MKRSPILPILLLTLSMPLHGKSPEQSRSIYDLTLKELMEVSVITAASDFEQSREQVFAAHTVITKQEWEAFGAATLSEALGAAAGLHVGKSTLGPTHHNYFLRGLGGSFGEQIRVMIDGRTLDRKYTGGLPFGFNLPLAGFKRIEVIRGPGSAVYGADAYAGIINLVSAQWQDRESEITLGGGNFGFQELSIQQAFGDEDHHLLLAADYMHYNDDPERIITRDIQSNFDDLFNTNASQAPGPMDERFEIATLNAHWQWQNWSLKYFGWRNFDGGVGAGGAMALDNQGHLKIKVDMYSLNWDLGKALDWQSLNVNLNFLNQKNLATYYLFPAGTELPIGNDGNTQFEDIGSTTLFSDGFIGAPDTYNNYLNFQITQLLTLQQHKVRWQLGYHKDSMRAREEKNFGPGVLNGTEVEVDDSLTDVSGSEHIFIKNIKRHFYYVSLMDQWQLSEQWLLNIGARYDHYSDFGSTTNPRLGLIYQVTPKAKIKLFTGSAFRAPSFSEKYVRNNPVIIGNDSLEPETVNTTETGLGVDYFFSDEMLLSANIFNYHAKNLIYFEFEQQLQMSQAQNSGKQKGRGFELNLRHKPQKNVTLQFNYSYLDAEDQHANPIANYPGKLLYASMNWHPESNWHWSIDGRWVSGRQRAATDSRPPVADYIWFDTTVSNTGLLPNLSLTLAIKNIFDTAAKEPASSNIPEDFPLHGRFWSLALKYHF